MIKILETELSDSMVKFQKNVRDIFQQDNNLKHKKTNKIVEG